MPIAPEDLAQRRPVWAALSSMFLDADVTLSRDWRVGLLARSPYPLQVLEQILTEEVYPVCCGNLNSGHPVVSSFDAAWLEATILQQGAFPQVYGQLLSLARMGHPGGRGPAARRARAGRRSPPPPLKRAAGSPARTPTGLPKRDNGGAAVAAHSRA
jgi:hypothetical protein